MMDALYMTVFARWPRAVLAIVALLVSSSVVGAEAAGTFPLPNPAANGKAGDKTPPGWTSFSTEGRYGFAVDTEVFHSAPSSVRIEGFTSTGRACLSVNTGELAPVQSYRLGFWYRTSRECALRGFARFLDTRKWRPGRQNGFFMHNFAMRGAPGTFAKASVPAVALAKAGEWREYSTGFSLSADLLKEHPAIRVSIALYGDPNGKAWFDDLSLTQAPPDPLEAETVKPKDLHLNTVLVASPAGGRLAKPAAVLSLPPDGRYDAIAERIQAKVKECSGITLPVRRDPRPQDALKETHVIALGNMATNPFIETLYRHYYTYLDLYYPGRGGHALQSVHNPYGAGHNVILVGGSDDEGVGRAAEALAQRLKPGSPRTNSLVRGKEIGLGWTMDIRLGEGLEPPPPGQPARAWCDYNGDRPST